MLPVLLDLKIIKIYTFGVFLVLAFFWGSFMLWKNIRLTSYKEDEIFDGLFLSLGGALLGGRAVYTILNFDKIGLDLLKFILINGYPGLSILGGLIGGLITLKVYFFYKKIKLRSAIDYFIAPTFIALALGKLGAFFSGQEVGTKTKLFFSIKYVGFEGTRHLTPVYESLLFFLGAYISYRLLFEIRKERYPHGFLMAFFSWYFAFVYFIFDKMKANQLYFARYSFNGLVSTLILLTSSFYFLYYFRSLIINRLARFTNFSKLYVSKTFQKIYLWGKRKVRAREK